MPTMMSAWPRRAISSRIAGVRVVAGTSSPYHRRVAAGVAGAWRACRGAPWGGPSAGRDGLRDAVRDVGCAGDRPVRVLLANEVARVRRAVAEVLEPEGAPRHERHHRR